MRRNELDYLLSTLLDAYEDVSDINLTVDKPFQVEVSGQLLPVQTSPPIDRLTPFQTETIAVNLLAGSQRLTDDLLRLGSCDSSYTLSDKARFRISIFSQKGCLSIVLRRLNAVIPTPTELNLPPITVEATHEKTGLVLVTGATGSGKSTTLASLVNEMNQQLPIHIITLEDPVEFVHTQKTATINQRELGTDFDSFANGLRAAMRQAPKVILVGEMRDRATVEIALSAAETGHLVFSTLHTIDAGQTINRILGLFEPDEQEQIRYRLADTLRWVFSQRLVPRINGGRYPVTEIMGSNLRTKESIVQGESEGKSFYEIIEASAPFGWRTFDFSCLEAYKKGIITEEVATQNCTKRGHVTRGIDLIKQQRGDNTFAYSDLRLSSKPKTDSTSPPISATLKLK